MWTPHKYIEYRYSREVMTKCPTQALKLLNLSNFRWVGRLCPIFTSFGSSSWTLPRYRLSIYRHFSGAPLLRLAIAIQAAFVQIPTIEVVN
jgi:hypothetical protein